MIKKTVKKHMTLEARIAKLEKLLKVKNEAVGGNIFDKAISLVEDEGYYCEREGNGCYIALTGSFGNELPVQAFVVVKSENERRMTLGITNVKDTVVGEDLVDVGDALDALASQDVDEIDEAIENLKSYDESGEIDSDIAENLNSSMTMETISVDFAKEVVPFLDEDDDKEEACAEAVKEEIINAVDRVSRDIDDITEKAKDVVSDLIRKLKKEKRNLK